MNVASGGLWCTEVVSPSLISPVSSTEQFHISQSRPFLSRGFDDDKFYIVGDDKENNEDEVQSEEEQPEEEERKFRIAKDLLIYKAFYFFFYGAVGSLFPYLAVFYKQLYLSAQQVGFLIGIRPFIQMGTCPLWGALADTYNVKKCILLMSIGAWLATNYSISIVRVPPETACNSTGGIIKFPQVGKLVEPIGNRIPNASVLLPDSVSSRPTGRNQSSPSNTTTRIDAVKKLQRKRNLVKDDDVYMLTLTHFKKKRKASPDLKNGARVRRKKRHQPTLINGFMAIIYSRTPRSTNTEYELWSETNSSKYDEEIPLQRMLGTDEIEEEFDAFNTDDEYPWPLDNIDYIPTDQSPESAQNALNIFVVLIIITTIGTVLSSPAATMADAATLEILGDRSYQYGNQRLWGAFGWGLCAFVVGAIVSNIQRKECEEGRHVDYILSFYVYAVMMALAFLCAAFFTFKPIDTTDYKESLWEAIKMFSDCQNALFVLTLLTTGSAMGFVHTFLFWHLHDLGGTQFLFSVISAVQCLSEVITYMFSSYLIVKIGCENVLYIGLLANVIRLTVYSFISQPIYSIPLEVLQGVSSASIWTASICYIGLIQGTPVTLQALLHGIYWGLGHGGGGILGGVLVTYIGSNATFLAYASICLLNFLILVCMEYRSKLMELLCNYTYVENIPAGTYILTTMSQRRPTDSESQTEQ